VTKQNPLDPRDQIAKARGAKPVCAWCDPHFRARLEGQPSDHTPCDDFGCGCHCQDGRTVN
jgi:hypothetical protein